MRTQMKGEGFGIHHGLYLYANTDQFRDEVGFNAVLSEYKFCPSYVREVSLCGYLGSFLLFFL